MQDIIIVKHSTADEEAVLHLLMDEVANQLRIDGFEKVAHVPTPKIVRLDIQASTCIVLKYTKSGKARFIRIKVVENDY